MSFESVPSQIVLAYSADSGVIALPLGEQHHRARTAMELAGFTQRDDGVHVLPLNGLDHQRTAVADLVRIAGEHDTTVTFTTRRYLGDVAEHIAQRLPGIWRATTEIYALPTQQDDLLPWLWDAGELPRTLTTTRIPYAAVLTDGQGGPDLILVERPGHDHEYLVGILAPTSDGTPDSEPNTPAPRSIVVTGEPDHTAHAITHRLLPDYHQALRSRRVHDLARALTRARTTQHQWNETARTRAGLDQERIAGLETWARYRIWADFRTFLDHGPALAGDLTLPSRRAAVSLTDDAPLDRLRAALDLGTQILRRTPPAQPADPPSAVLAQLTDEAWPAIETWLADGHVLIHHLLKTEPRQAPAVALPPPAPRRPRWPPA